MNTLKVLSEIIQKGLSLRVLDGAILARPAELVTPEVGDAIRENKPALVAVLERSADLPKCSACGGDQVAVPTFDGYENFECVACDRCSGCRRASQ